MCLWYIILSRDYVVTKVSKRRQIWESTLSLTWKAFYNVQHHCKCCSRFILSLNPDVIKSWVWHVFLWLKILQHSFLQFSVCFWSLFTWCLQLCFYALSFFNHNTDVGLSYPRKCPPWKSSNFSPLLPVGSSYQFLAMYLSPSFSCLQSTFVGCSTESQHFLLLSRDNTVAINKPSISFISSFSLFHLHPWAFLFSEP